MRIHYQGIPNNAEMSMLTKSHLLPLAILATVSTLHADEPKPSIPFLAVGKKMPFHIATFVNGDRSDGCPGVMIANSRQRGIVLWSRGINDAAFQLASALENATNIQDKTSRYLVAFDADPDALAERSKGYVHVRVGKARKSAQQMLDDHGIDAKTAVIVCFVDKDKIAHTQSFADAELTETRIKQLARAAATFAQGEALAAELKQLEGQWQLTSAIKNGEPTPDDVVKKIHIVISDGKHSVYFGDDAVVKDVPFSIDPTTNPKTTTDTLVDGKQIHGIYKLEADTLTSCVAEADQPAPTEFKSEPNSNHTLRTFKRINTPK